MRLCFAPIGLWILTGAVLAVSTGCGGDQAAAGAAASVEFVESSTGGPVGNTTVYFSVLDSSGKSVHAGLVTTDAGGIGLFEGLPTQGKHTLKLWTIEGFQCLLEVDLGKFTGAGYGASAGACRS
jgi:hypothetical protein